MRSPTSRKHFFAKLLGLAALAGGGAQARAEAAPAKPAAPSQSKLTVRNDARAVARRVDSV